MLRFKLSLQTGRNNQISATLRQSTCNAGTQDVGACYFLFCRVIALIHLKDPILRQKEGVQKQGGIALVRKPSKLDKYAKGSHENFKCYDSIWLWLMTHDPVFALLWSLWRWPLCSCLHLDPWLLPLHLYQLSSSTLVSKLTRGASTTGILQSVFGRWCVDRCNSMYIDDYIDIYIYRCTMMYIRSV